MISKHFRTVPARLWAFAESVDGNREKNAMAMGANGVRLRMGSSHDLRGRGELEERISWRRDQ